MEIDQQAEESKSETTEKKEESKEVQVQNISGVIAKLKENICNRTIDVQFRMVLLKCMDGIMRHDPAKAKEMAD